jgi:hypothetical protein
VVVRGAGTCDPAFSGKRGGQVSRDPFTVRSVRSTRAWCQRSARGVAMGPRYDLFSDRKNGSCGHGQFGSIFRRNLTADRAVLGNLGEIREAAEIYSANSFV